MRVEIVELQDRHIESRHEVRWVIVPHLHDNHDRLCDQRPTSKRQSQSLMDAKFPDRSHRFAAADRNAPAMLAVMSIATMLPNGGLSNGRSRGPDKN